MTRLLVLLALAVIVAYALRRKPDVTARRVWDALERDPVFVKGMEQAERERLAGLFKPFRHTQPQRVRLSDIQLDDDEQLFV